MAFVFCIFGKNLEIVRCAKCQAHSNSVSKNNKNGFLQTMQIGMIGLHPVVVCWQWMFAFARPCEFFFRLLVMVVRRFRLFSDSISAEIETFFGEFSWAQNVNQLLLRKHTSERIIHRNSFWCAVRVIIYTANVEKEKVTVDRIAVILSDYCVERIDKWNNVVLCSLI